jgi:Alkylmercury lyase
MAQNVPDFRFSEDALKVRQFIYEFWCARGYPPNLRDAAEATGFSRRRLMQTYRELDLGIMIVIDQEAENVNILKCMPFSAYPSQARLIIDGRFNGYLGCAMEAMAASKMPPFAGKACQIEAYCACCLAPVRLVMTDGALSSADPQSALVHVSLSPWYWNTTDVMRMCDSMNFTIDRSHAERYERQTGRRGAIFTLQQAIAFVSRGVATRMWDPHRAPDFIRPEELFDGLKALGVDTSVWER